MMNIVAKATMDSFDQDELDSGVGGIYVPFVAIFLVVNTLVKSFGFE